MNKIENKMAFRKMAKKRLQRRLPYRFADSAKANILLENLLSMHQPESILFYLPMDHEVDVSSVLKKARKKHKVYVPFMFGDSFKMVAYRLPLIKGKFNILEPKNSPLNIKKVDMIIVPILGIDKTNRRIGFGKGMYDRFYERLADKPIVVFLQTTLCQTTSVITDDYDIKADYIVTPKEIKIIK
jgi:5-formyltetrahydrofolate cyclo-ligase